MSERTDFLRNKFLSITRAGDTERCVLITEADKLYGDRSEAVKRALSLSYVLKNMTIHIYDKELIVGCHTQEVRHTPLFPDYAAGWISEELDDIPVRDGDSFIITEEQKAVIRETLGYWKGRAIQEKIMNSIPPELQEIIDQGVVYNATYQWKSPGHIVPDYEYLINTGFEKMIEICEQKIKDLDMLSDDYLEKREFYIGEIEMMKGCIAYANRFADLALDMAASELDETRKAELLKISQICRNVPAKPASSFWEGLQFVYFVQLIMQLEGNGLAISIGRMDKYLYPLYQKDVDAGELNYDDALELMGCMYLKLAEIDKISSNGSTAFNRGPAHGQTITIGGTYADGSDITNDISILVLEADRIIHLSQPDIAARIHEGTSQRFIDAVTENVKMGINKVKIYNDKVITEALLKCGVEPEDAYDFGFLGCSEPVICGKTNSWGNCGHINLAKCLELALNNGVCMLTGKQLGLKTGEPEDLKTIEDVKDAYRKQVNYFCDILVKYDRMVDMGHKMYMSLPFCSLTIEGCIEKGIDFERGGAKYNFISPLCVGPITVGDSLEALKVFVFDEKKFTMREMVDMLKSDFKDNEAMRLLLKNRAPKYGNDIDEADEMSDFAIEVICDAMEGYKTARGGMFTPGIYYLAANIPNGRKTAATPNGRHAGEPLNDGGVSPTHGDDKLGATAIFKSAGKLCNARAGHGSVLNQLLHPSIFKGEDSDRIFGEYMRSIVDCGVWESQFNVITHEELKAAQKNPDDYRSLVVRVAGYSAFFTDLGKDVQDDIIDRTSLMNF